MKLTKSLVLTTLILTGCGGSGGASSARTPEQSSHDAAIEKAKQQQKLEEDDPIVKEILAASKAGAPLEPDAVMSRLEASCKAGNRHSCLNLEINRVQRGGAKTALLEYASAHYDARLYPWDYAFVSRAGNIKVCLGGLSDGPTWAACQSVKAHFLSEHASKAVSGPSLAKLFPSGDPPEDFPMVGLNLLFKVAPGAGWSCFSFHREALQSGAYFKDPDGGPQCSRTMQDCQTERARTEKASTSTVRVTARGCSPMGVVSVFFYEDGPGKLGYAATSHERCGEIRKEMSSLKPSLCVEVGDLIAPAL